MHPAFTIQKSILVNLQNVCWDLEGINLLLNSIVDKSESGIAGGIVGNQASNQANSAQSIGNQAIKLFGLLDSNQASTIAGGIARGIAEKLTAVVQMAIVPISRKELLLGLSLVSNANNFETYIQPLVEKQWITMTIPDKPTSPKQKYLTTLKGRLILEILKANKK